MRKRAFVVMAVAIALTIVGLWTAARRAEAIIIIGSKGVDTGRCGVSIAVATVGSQVI